MSHGPLSGIRVLELAGVLAGPYCGMLLAEMGADVIKVERPGLGDDLRTWGPPFTADGESTYFLQINRNKRSIAVDIKTPEGRDLVYRLASRVDVLIENFRPGGLKKAGLDEGLLQSGNPGLVHCSITAFGDKGPRRDQPGYDVVLQAMSGLMSVTGEVTGPPVRAGVAVVDIATGLTASNGILAALVARGRTGKGQKVELSLLGVALSLMPNLTAGYLIGNVAPERLGNGHPNACPYGVFATRDGFIVLACGNDGQWRRLCLALGHLELAEHHDWGTNSVRIRRRREVDAAVSRWFRKWSTNDLTALLESHQVPNGPINTIGQALADPQVSALELVREVVHPTSGRLRLLGTALSMPEMDERTETPAPLLGQHRDEIISELLGLSADEIDALVRSGAFGEVAAEPGDAGLQVAQARQ